MTPEILGRVIEGYAVFCLALTWVAARQCRKKLQQAIEEEVGRLPKTPDPALEAARDEVDSWFVSPVR